MNSEFSTKLNAHPETFRALIHLVPQIHMISTQELDFVPSWPDYCEVGSSQ